MPSARTLVHLVSEQALPNLLPILALRPTRVLQVRSSDPRFDEAPVHVARAAEMAGVTTTFIDDPDCLIPEQAPGIDATRSCIERLHRRYHIDLVNITCGTKLMSIGAHEFARSRGIPSLYVEQDWIAASTGQLPAFPPLNEVAHRLTVAQVLTAYGLDASSLVMTRPNEAQIAFGATALRLFSSDAGPSVSQYLRGVRERLRPGGRDPRKTEIGGIMARGLPGPDDDVQYEFLQAAAVAGVVHEDGVGQWHCAIPRSHTSSHARVKAVLRCLQDLEGTWFEYACAKAMLDSGRFCDVRVGVQSRKREDSLGETDIVAVDPARLGLVFVSCKVSDRYVSPLEHVFATRQRAVEFGGGFSRTVFCVHSFQDGGRRRTFEDACRALRCGLVAGRPDFVGEGWLS